MHLDLGTDENQASSTYYGIPYNVVNGAALGWAVGAGVAPPQSSGPSQPIGTPPSGHEAAQASIGIC